MKVEFNRGGGRVTSPIILNRKSVFMIFIEFLNIFRGVRGIFGVGGHKTPIIFFFNYIYIIF